MSSGFHLIIRMVRWLIRSLFTLSLVSSVYAQVLERDAVTIPVGVRAKFFTVVNPSWSASLSVEGGESGSSSESVTDPYFEAKSTKVLRPGKEYFLAVNQTNIANIAIEVDPPTGYRVYLDNIRRNRVTSVGATLKIRIESEMSAPVGEASSLRPGRIVWTVGLGSLSNGQSAGVIGLRQASSTGSGMPPSALIYDNASPEVECIRFNNVIRQIYATSCLVDVTGSSTTTTLKFYPRTTGQIGPKVNGVYTVTGDPIYEYNIDNLMAPPYTYINARIIRTIRQGGSTHQSWTQMSQENLNGAFRTIVVDWVERVGTNPIQGPVNRVMSTDPNTETMGIGVTPAIAVNNPAYREVRTYGNFSSFRELAKIDTGYYDTKSFDYATNMPGRLFICRPSNGESIFYSYATPSLYGSVSGSVATKSYSYAYDWAGYMCLPESATTTELGNVTAKTTWGYSYEDIVDGSRNYQDAANATMKLVVETKYQYYETYANIATVTKSFRADSDSEFGFFPGLPHSVKRPDGTMAVTLYFRGTFDNSTRVFTPLKGGPEILQLTLNGVGVVSNDSVSLPQYTLGDQTQPTDAIFRIVPGASTASVLIRGADGSTQSTQSWICTGTTAAPAWQTVQRDVYFYTSGFFLERTSRDSGSGIPWDVLTNSWSGGRIDYTIDDSGVRNNFTYDSVNRVATRTRVAPGLQDLTTTYTYDATNHITKEVTGNVAGEFLETRRTYDLGGNLSSETVPGYATGGSAVSSITTNYMVNPWLRTKTITAPTGSTRIEASRPDGRLYSITGTAVVPEYYTYSSEANGSLRTRVDVGIATSARYRETWTDMLGRTVINRQLGFTGQVANEETNAYDGTTGYLISTTRTGLGKTLYTYSSMAQLIRTGMDVDSSGTLIPASNDRITDTGSTFEFLDGAWWSVKTSSNYPFTGGGAATSKETGKIRERLTGRTNALRSETRTYDANGAETRVVTGFDTVESRVVVTTRRAGIVNDQVEKSIAGLVLDLTGHDGLTLQKRYDALGRLEKEIEPRTGTLLAPTKRYYYQTNTIWPSEVRDATNRRLTLTRYDSAGRVNCTEDATGRTTRTSYTVRGEVEKVWGTATYPLSYVYNEYGERIKMRTYRDPGNVSATDTTSFPSLGAYDETTWEYDIPSGLLKKKYDAKNKFIEYTYNHRGQIYQRFWSRTLGGTNRVTTTYSYDPVTGENTGIVYNDGTPSVAYAYTRLGQVDAVTDDSGTRDFIYDPTKPWQLASEALDSFYNGRLLTRTYDSATATSTSDTSYPGYTLGTAAGRVSGVKLGTGSTLDSDLDFTYAMANTGRIVGLVSKRGGGAASRQFVYGYEPNSALVKVMKVMGNSFYVVRDFEPNRDLLTNMETQWNSTVRTKYVYAYDDRRLRQSVVQSGDVFADYGGTDNGAIHQIFSYNGRGELTAGATFMGATATDQSQPLSARRHEFDYDGIGNRRWSNTSGNSSLRDNYTVNQLNQYTQRENNTLSAGGLVANDNTIKVAVGKKATALAGRAGRYWGDNVVVDNANKAFFGPLSISAVKPGNSSTAYSIETVTRTATMPPQFQSLTYDDDGNLIGDGMWDYGWDAENRLRGMVTTAAAVAAGVPLQKIVFRYDYQHRRIEKMVLTGPTFATVVSHRRYLYDGWSMIAEFAVSGSTLTLARSYTWGLDIARSLSDAGGVGALLQIRDHAQGKDYFPSYDGNGNIVALFDANSTTGTCVATYEYSPYGEFLRSEGVYAKDNPFRFSTKFTDDETGLVYYGRRYYSPSQGRFLGRDPIEEQGGLNLYGFCGNNGVNLWDVLGMSPDYAPTSAGEVYRGVEIRDGVIYNVTYQARLTGREGVGDEVEWEFMGETRGGTVDVGADGNATRGMPEDGGFLETREPGFSISVGAVSRPQIRKTAQITFIVAFDSTIQNPMNALAAVQRNVAQMQAVFNATPGLQHIQINVVNGRTIAEVPEGGYVERRNPDGSVTDTITPALNTIVEHFGATAGTVPLLLTNDQTNRITTRRGTAAAVTANGGTVNAAILMGTRGLQLDQMLIAHEGGHAAGYRNPANPADPSHSNVPGTIMWRSPRGGGRNTDPIYVSVMARLAVPIPGP